ncbi:MAG: hypothetical protein ACMUJM_01965 [bacterium]
MLKKNRLLYGILYSVIIFVALIIGIGLCKEKKDAEQIVPGFNKMPIKELAHHVNIDKQKIVNMLKLNGIRVKDANQPLFTIATNNEILPTLIYEMITTEGNYNIPQSKSSNSRRKVSGVSGATPSYSPQRRAKKSDRLDQKWGSLDMKAVCRDLNIPIEEAKKYLKAKGILINNNDEKLRDIASHYNIRPRDIIAILRPELPGTVPSPSLQ